MTLRSHDAHAAHRQVELAERLIASVQPFAAPAKAPVTARGKVTPAR